MDAEAKVVEHLKMIQPIITRMSSAMFSVKTLCLTVFSLFTGFAVKDDVFILSGIFFPFLFLFLLLDLFYFRQEKLYRKLYDTVRYRNYTDCSMDTSDYKKEIRFWKGFKSIAIWPFYLTLLLFNCGVFVWKLIEASCN